jgi:hypothetical protein
MAEPGGDFSVRRLLGGLLVLALASSAAFCAKGAPVAATPAAAEAAESPRVTLTVREAELRDVLGTIAEQIGAKLALDPKIKGKISLAVTQAKLEDVMDNLCQAFNCEWDLSPGEPPELRVRHVAE